MELSESVLGCSFFLFAELRLPSLQSISLEERNNKKVGKPTVRDSRAIWAKPAVQSHEKFLFFVSVTFHILLK